MLQSLMVREYKKIYGNPTLKETATLTGIQITRVHRIFNGSEMKLSEYQSFRSLINLKTKKNLNSQESIETLLENCLKDCSDYVLDDLKNFLRQKLETARLMKRPALKNQNILKAGA